MRRAMFFLLAALSVAAAAPATASPATNAFTTVPITIGPTTVDTPIGAVTVTGAVNAEIIQFRVDESGRLVAIATLSGSVSATTPLGTVRVDVTRARVVLRASVTADCAGNLKISFNAVAQLDATVTVTNIQGQTLATFRLAQTIPLQGSLAFTASTPEHQELICEISKLLQTQTRPPARGASDKALVDKLNTLLALL
jgi:hypothetical protein